MIKVGTVVKWKWGSGIATGKVIEVFTKDIIKTIKGSLITRNQLLEIKRFISNRKMVLKF